MPLRSVAAHAQVRALFDGNLLRVLGDAAIHVALETRCVPFMDRFVCVKLGGGEAHKALLALPSL